LDSNVQFIRSTKNGRYPAKAIFTEASTISGAGNCLPPVEVIFGQTEVMSLVRRKVEKSVAAGVPILIEGPNGCGKEVIARYVHAISPRRSGNFAKVNCAALPGPLMESELFGYERGAFTGAVNSKPGRLESETPGTILLDEVIDLNADLQAKTAASAAGREILPAWRPRRKEPYFQCDIDELPTVN